MQMEYRCSNQKCQRPADLIKKRVGRTVNGNLITSKEPVKTCAACGREVKLLPV